MWLGLGALPPPALNSTTGRAALGGGRTAQGRRRNEEVTAAHAAFAAAFQARTASGERRTASGERRQRTGCAFALCMHHQTSLLLQCFRNSSSIKHTREASGGMLAPADQWQLRVDDGGARGLRRCRHACAFAAHSLCRPGSCHPLTVMLHDLASICRRRGVSQSACELARLAIGNGSAAARRTRRRCHCCSSPGALLLLPD